MNLPNSRKRILLKIMEDFRQHSSSLLKPMKKLQKHIQFTRTKQFCYLIGFPIRNLHGKEMIELEISSNSCFEKKISTFAQKHYFMENEEDDLRNIELEDIMKK